MDELKQFQNAKLSSNREINTLCRQIQKSKDSPDSALLIADLFSDLQEAYKKYVNSCVTVISLLGDNDEAIKLIENEMDVIDDKILVSRKLKADAELNKVVLDSTARKKEDETNKIESLKDDYRSYMFLFKDRIADLNVIKDNVSVSELVITKAVGKINITKTNEIIEWQEQKYCQLMNRIEALKQNMSVTEYISGLEKNKSDIKNLVSEIRNTIDNALKSDNDIDDVNNTSFSSNTAGLNSMLSGFNIRHSIDSRILPKFDGDRRAFLDFKQGFMRQVHDKLESDDARATYLRSQAVMPNASIRNMLKNLSYQDMWEVLDKEFLSRKLVAESLETSWKSKKAVKSLGKEYCDLIREFQSALKTIEHLNIRDFVTEHALLWILIEKIPTDIGNKVRVAYLKSDDTTVNDIIDILKEGTLINHSGKSVTGSNDKHKQKVNVVDSSSPWSCAVDNCNYKKKHYPSQCRVFKALKYEDRVKVIKDNKLCDFCFNKHSLDKCEKKQEWDPCKVDDCGEYHHKLLHKPNTSESINSAQTISDKKASLMLQKVKVSDESDAILFWDSGSTTNLITHDFAKKVDLKGSGCTLDIVGVGEKTDSLKTKLYTVPLFGKNGKLFTVQAYGMDKITGCMESFNATKAADIFGIEEDCFDDVNDSVDILIGSIDLDLFPTRAGEFEGLVLYNSIFGTGSLVAGCSKDGESHLELSAHVVARAETRSVKPLDFLSAEGFGVDIPRKCKLCKGCKECGIKSTQMSYTESKELEEIEQGLSLDTSRKKWTAKYPYNTDPSVLCNNYSQALHCMKRLEKRLIANGKINDFNAQFQENVERSVFEEIDPDNCNYSGPINYITITDTYKDDEGKTTPIRLCMNSSMKFNGVSLNDIMMKGPSSLNNIYNVLLNFRTYPIGFVKDLSKFYNSVLADEKDQHLRRVIWRNGKVDDKPKVFKTNTVNFGDKAAGCIAVTAVRETADLYKHIDNDAADQLKHDSYVDDTASGADTKNEAVKISDHMDKIVNLGGFKFKKTTMTGDDVVPMKILGTFWDPKNDTIYVDCKVNPSPKMKGVKIQKDLDLFDLIHNLPEIITKKIVWRIAMGQYDILGLASVFFVRLKLVMRDLSDEDGRAIGWDDPIPEDVKKRFVIVLDQMKHMLSLRFPRCVAPQGKGCAYDLLVFADGSKQAFCTLAYLRYKISETEYKCTLLSGKTRVAPLKKISVPRIELLGALAAVRLAESIQNGCRLEIKRRYFFTDSSAVLGMINSECGAFNEFVGTRLGEIKSKCNPAEEWLWLATKENLADMGTREDTVPKDLEPGSEYQEGKDWMAKDVTEWPTSRNPGKAPTEELTKAAQKVMVIDDKVPLIHLERFTSFTKVKRILANVFLFILKLKKKAVGLDATNLLTMAEDYLIVQEQSTVKDLYNNGKLNSLLPTMKTIQIIDHDEDILVTNGRMGGALSVGYDKDELPLMNCTSQVARLLMTESHKIGHNGVDRTLQRSRNIAWIIQGKKLAKSISFNCCTCKRRNAKLENQRMAPLPEFRLKPAPPFHTTHVDLFGPILIKDSVKKRVSSKVWGVLFCCSVTTAIHLEVTENYSTDSFIQALKRFMNLRNTPATIISDPGTQLMSAAKKLGNWDWTKIKETGRGEVEWKFIPTDSQHYNGLCEAFIKQTKKQLTNAIKVGKFTKGEIDTIFSDVMYIMNTRPLAVRAGEDPLSGGPITPLHLLGARGTLAVPRMKYDEDPSPNKRLAFLESVVDDWWKKWFAQVFHNLVPCKKWTKEHRDVKVGDVVLLKDSNLLRREYRLARVTEVKPSVDGHARRILLQYKTHPDDTIFKTTERSIQNIVVIIPNDD
jgi:hypothetical protein